jgi:hypothetical protein
MKLKLPDVTLVMMDGTCPELARLALQDTLELIEPRETLVFTPQPLLMPGTVWAEVPQWPDADSYCDFLWYELHKYIHTKFMLSIQWDAWVIDAGMWTDEFLEYDYVGAPWWFNDRYNVGNGTALRSLGLMRFLAEHSDVFTVDGKEDELLCRVYRPTLERHGFKWAPEQLASRFAFECARPSCESKHFMFHDSFNFPTVLDGSRLKERVRLMQENHYIRQGRKLTELETGRKPVILDRLGS